MWCLHKCVRMYMCVSFSMYVYTLFMHTFKNQFGQSPIATSMVQVLGEAFGKLHETSGRQEDEQEP